jgi:hypothetical protein
MNSLSTLPFRLSYRTGRDDLMRDFLNPGLECSVPGGMPRGGFRKRAGDIDRLSVHQSVSPVVTGTGGVRGAGGRAVF